MPRRPMSGRGLLGRLGLVVASCAVTLGLVEAGLRVVPAWSRATTRDERFAFNPYRPDGRLGFTLHPGVRVSHVDRDFSVSVAVNTLGMRGSERGPSKPPGTARIFSLEGHRRIGEALAAQLAGEPALQRAAAGRQGGT